MVHAAQSAMFLLSLQTICLPFALVSRTSSPLVFLTNYFAHKQLKLIRKTTTLHVPAETIFCTFLCYLLHDFGVELPDFTFYRERNFYISLSLSLNLDMVLRSSAPTGVAYFGQSKVE